jgi:phosphatidate cytidylyltransferase
MPIFIEKFAAIFPFSQDLLHSPRVIEILFALAAVLMSSQFFTFILSKVYKKKNFATIRYRILTWWQIWLLISLAMLCGQHGGVFLFSTVSFLALREFISTVQLTQIPKPVLAMAYLAIPVQYSLVFYDQYELFLIFIPLFMHVLLSLFFIIGQQTKNFVYNLGQLHWGLLLTVFSISYVAYFLNLDDPRTEVVEPLGLITYVIVVTQMNDVWQFLFGKMLGKHKILPRVSPNKTYEGFFGGIAASTLLSYALGSYLTPMPTWACLFSGVLLSVMGFLGDNLMSSIKRDKQVKDFGTFLKGHGGMLDRVDSLILAAPVFFHFYRFFFPEFYH